ncbi:MAG: hypothetical protein AB7U46_16640 [Paenirhodobacter sp.]|uniref:hypothetical protein n=1 Tax=Paenirhodobacter sp. TaxID=1965326 RepID=UPI003D0FF7F3
MFCLLCPVPAVHLPSAMETFEREGRVAFGSNATELLLGLDLSGEGYVWIAASSTGGGAPGIDVGKVVLKGRLAAITPPGRRGGHPDPRLRPASTQTDDAFLLYWELSAFERVSPALPLAQFKTRAGKALSAMPHGPTLIACPEEI